MELISDAPARDASLVWSSGAEQDKPETNHAATDNLTTNHLLQVTSTRKQLEESPIKVKPIVLGELNTFDTDSNDGIFSRSNLCSPDVTNTSCTPLSSSFHDHEDCGFADGFDSELFEELGVLCSADPDQEYASVATGDLAVVRSSLPTNPAAGGAMGKHVQMKRMKLLLRKIDASKFATRNSTTAPSPVQPVNSAVEQRKEVTLEDKVLLEPSLTSEEEAKSSDEASTLLSGSQGMVREMDLSDNFTLSLQEETEEEEDIVEGDCNQEERSGVSDCEQKIDAADEEGSGERTPACCQEDGQEGHCDREEVASACVPEDCLRDVDCQQQEDPEKVGGERKGSACQEEGQEGHYDRDEVASACNVPERDFVVDCQQQEDLEKVGGESKGSACQEEGQGGHDDGDQVASACNVPERDVDVDSQQQEDSEKVGGERKGLACQEEGQEGHDDRDEVASACNVPERDVDVDSQQQEDPEKVGGESKGSACQGVEDCEQETDSENHDVDTAYHLKLSESIKTLQDVIGTQDVRTPSPAPSAEAPPTPSPEKHFTTDPASGEKHKKTAKQSSPKKRRRRRKQSRAVPVDQPAPDTSETYDLLVPDGIQSPADIAPVSKKRKLSKLTNSKKTSSKHEKNSQSSVEEKSDKQTDDSVTKKSRTKRLTKSQKKRQRDHETEQENLTEEDVDERPLSKRSPCDVDKRPLSKRALEAESSHSLQTSKKQKKEKHKHKHKKHKKSRRKLNREEIESMLGEELMKLKEQLKEVHSGANSVIENTEKLKDTIRTKIREVKAQKLMPSESDSNSPKPVTKSVSDTDSDIAVSTDPLPETIDIDDPPTSPQPNDKTCGADPSSDTSDDHHEIFAKTIDLFENEKSSRTRASLARTMTCARCRPTPNRYLERCIQLPSMSAATPESSDTESDTEREKEAYLPSGRQLSSVIPSTKRDQCSVKLKFSDDICDLFGQLRQIYSVLKDLKIDWPFFSHVLHFALALEEMIWWVSDIGVEQEKQLQFDYNRHLCLPSYVLGALLVEVGIVLRNLKMKLAAEPIPSALRSAVNTAYYINKYVRLFIAHGFREPSEFLIHVNQASEGARSVNEVCSLTGFSAAVSKVDKNITELSRRVRKRVYHETINHEVMQKRNFRSDFTVKHNSYYDDDDRQRNGDPESNFAAWFPHNETLREKKGKTDGCLNKPSASAVPISSSHPLSARKSLPSDSHARSQAVNDAVASQFVNGRLSVPTEASKKFTNIDNLLASASDGRLQRHVQSPITAASSKVALPKSVQIQTVSSSAASLTNTHLKPVLCTRLSSSAGALPSSFSSPMTCSSSASTSLVGTSLLPASSSTVVKDSLSNATPSISASNDQSQASLSPCNQQTQAASTTPQQASRTSTTASESQIRSSCQVLASSSVSTNTAPLVRPKMTHVSSASTLPVVGPRYQLNRPTNLNTSILSPVVLARQISPTNGSVPCPVYSQQPLQTFPACASTVPHSFPVPLSPMSSSPTSPLSPYVVQPRLPVLFPLSGSPPLRMPVPQSCPPPQPRYSLPSLSRPALLYPPTALTQENRRFTSQQPVTTSFCHRPSHFNPGLIAATIPDLLNKTVHVHQFGPRPGQANIRPQLSYSHPSHSVCRVIETLDTLNNTGKGLVTVTPTPRQLFPLMTRPPLPSPSQCMPSVCIPLPVEFGSRLTSTRFTNVVKTVNANSTTYRPYTNKQLSPLEKLIVQSPKPNQVPISQISKSTAATDSPSSLSPGGQQESVNASQSCSTTDKQEVSPVSPSTNTDQSSTVDQNTPISSTEGSCAVMKENTTPSSDAEQIMTISKSDESKSPSTPEKQISSPQSSVPSSSGEGNHIPITSEILTRMIQIIQKVEPPLLFKPLFTPAAIATSESQLPVVSANNQETTDSNKTTVSTNSSISSSTTPLTSPPIPSNSSASDGSLSPVGKSPTNPSSSSTTAVNLTDDSAPSAASTVSSKQPDNAPTAVSSSLPSSSLSISGDSSNKTESKSEESNVIVPPSQSPSTADEAIPVSDSVNIKFTNSSLVASSDKGTNTRSSLSSSKAVNNSAAPVSSTSSSSLSVNTTSTSVSSSLAISSLPVSSPITPFVHPSQSLVSPGPAPLIIKEKLLLTVDIVDKSINLVWTLPKQILSAQGSIKQYEICYMKSPSSSDSISSKCADYGSNWSSLGIIDALPLPMSVTVTKFNHQSCYLFVVKGSLTLKSKTYVIYSAVKEVVIS